MLIPLQYLIDKYHPKLKGVIHVGAHYAEEHDDYVKAGINKFMYFEPCRKAFEIMFDKLKAVEGIALYKAACGRLNDFKKMYTASFNKGESNSLLQPKLHLQQHPEVIFDDTEEVIVYALDFIMPLGFNFLAMDVQGYEGEVLKGAIETLSHIDYIYTEVNNGETYAGNALIEEIDELLKDFKRVETKWAGSTTWGDAFYVRKTLL